MVSAGVVTPASTSARNDRGHDSTPSNIPTPQALFTGPTTHTKGLGNTYSEGEADETVQACDQAQAEEEAYETESSGSEAEEQQAEKERQKRAYRVEEQRQRRKAVGTEITDQEQKEADEAEIDYYRSSPLRARIRRRSEADHKLLEQARRESGTKDIDTSVVMVGMCFTSRVIIKKITGPNEVVYIMSNEGIPPHPTQWVSVNPDLCTRD
jgi:hypothetical protein